MSAFGQRSEGAGGALGVTTNVSRCAVVGCNEPGRPQQCPYDGTYHRHGAVHYDCGYPTSALKFHKGDWYWVCDTHISMLAAERKAFEARPK